MARLFIAVWPPEDLRRRLSAALEAAAGSAEAAAVPALRWTRPEQWHVTLRFLGSCEPDAVCRRLDALAWPAATAAIGPGLSTIGSSVLHIPVSGLDGLAAVVRAATADIGRPPQFRTFVGHLTVARAGRRTPLPAGLAQRWQHVDLAGRFAVHEVALVESETEAAGARYRTLRHWRIPPDPELSC